MKPRSIRIILFAFLCLFGSLLYAQETARNTDVL